MSLGEKIQKYRKKAGISQEELADRLGVTRQSISLWETDQTVPSLDSLLTLAEIFNVSLDSLCNREISQSQNNNDEDKKTEKRNDVPLDNEADEKIDYEAYCETHYTKNLIKRANRLSIQKMLIACIAAIFASFMLVLNILLTDEISNELLLFPAILIIIVITPLITAAVRNKKILDKNAKDDFSCVCKYWFYNDHIDIEVQSKDSFSKLSVKYSDIKKRKEDNDYYFIFINNAIYAIDKANLVGDGSSVFKYFKYTEDNKANNDNKKHSGINTLLLTMFILSLLSIFIALFIVVIFIKTSPIPEFDMTMVEYMWAFFLVVPIPLTSAILGVIFLRKKYKCKKNIIAGIIVCVLLCIYGCFPFAFKDQIGHDFKYVYKIENAVSIDLPDNGYVSYQIVNNDQNVSTKGMIKFDNADEIYFKLKSDERFKSNTTLIPSNYVNSFDLAVTQDYDFFMLYDVTCRAANIAAYGNHERHRFIYLAYSIETNILYFIDFVK